MHLHGHVDERSVTRVHSPRRRSPCLHSCPSVRLAELGARSACSAATAAKYRRSGLAPRSPSRLARQPHDGPPGAQEQARSNSQHGASPPQNGQRGRLARCRPTVLPAMPGHKRHSSPGRLDAHPLLHDGTYPRRPCPPHPPVMLVTIAAGPEPRCSSPTELGAVAARCEHRRSRRPCNDGGQRTVTVTPRGPLRWPPAADLHERCRPKLHGIARINSQENWCPRTRPTSQD